MTNLHSATQGETLATAQPRSTDAQQPRSLNASSTLDGAANAHAGRQNNTPVPTQPSTADAAARPAPMTVSGGAQTSASGQMDAGYHR